jgi:hypothetical protein
MPGYYYLSGIRDNKKEVGLFSFFFANLFPFVFSNFFSGYHLNIQCFTAIRRLWGFVPGNRPFYRLSGQFPAAYL